MRKAILGVGLIGLTSLMSCSNNGKQVESQNAKEVTDNTKTQTVKFNSIGEGSYVDWRASHLGGAQPRFGKIYLNQAEFSMNNNELVNATVVMDMGSFTVENFPEGDENIEKLKGHLQSDDFFDVPNYPTATFQLTNLKKLDGEFNSEVTGNLTIMEVTKSISFKAKITSTENEVSMKSEDFAIDRSDWNLTYHAEGTEGVPVNYLIADDIGFTIDLALSKS